MFLTVKDVCCFGLKLAKIRLLDKWDQERKELEFHKHYGSSSLTYASLWHDILHFDDFDDQTNHLKLKQKEKSMKGFKSFMVAVYFFWNYPRNSNVLASRFEHQCEFYCPGYHLWIWVERIQMMKKKVIVWPKDLPQDLTYAFTIDGVDFCVWEPKHATQV